MSKVNNSTIIYNKSIHNVRTLLPNNDMNNIEDTDEIYKILKNKYTLEKVKHAIKFYNSCNNSFDFERDTTSSTHFKNDSYDSRNNSSNKCKNRNCENVQTLSGKNNVKINLKITGNISKNKFLPPKIPINVQTPIVSSISNNKFSTPKGLKSKIPFNTNDCKFKKRSSSNSHLSTEKEFLQLINLTESLESINSSKCIKDNNSDFIKLEKLEGETLKQIKNKFIRKEKLTRREIVSLRKFIPQITFNITDFENKKHFIEFNKKLNEIMSNDPRLILELIDKKEISETHVIDYFNLGNLKITWTENLEKIYRDIVYNKNYLRSNSLKTTYFLIRSGFNNLIKKNFHDKHMKTIETITHKEINEMSYIYDKIIKYPIDAIKLGCFKIDSIYETKDKILHRMINKARDKYYEKNVFIFKMKDNTEKQIYDHSEKLETCSKIQLKKFIFNFRNFVKGIKTKNEINKIKIPLKNFNPCNDQIDKLNMKYVEKFKSSINYIKTYIKFHKSELFSNNWKNIFKKNKQNKIIINYFVELIQSHFRGHKFRIYIHKFYEKIKIIMNYLRKYCYCKKTAISFFRLKEFTYNEFKYVVQYRSLINNYKNFRLFLTNQDIEVIKDFAYSVLKINNFKIGNVVKLHKLLIFIINSIEKLNKI